MSILFPKTRELRTQVPRVLGCPSSTLSSRCTGVEMGPDFPVVDHFGGSCDRLTDKHDLGHANPGGIVQVLLGVGGGGGSGKATESGCKGYMGISQTDLPPPHR